MKIRVLFFGLARDITGFGWEEVDLGEENRLADLRGRYECRFPRLAELSRSLVATVNQEVASSSHALAEGDEVAFLPPVSGGAGADFFRITREAISAARLADQLKNPADGAVVTFEGTVRDNLRGRRTQYLEYEAYEPMAVRKMEEIGNEARQKFAIHSIGIVHRVGRLEIGESSVAIVVTAAHRHAAFEACHFLINRLKQVVPVWKKEHLEDGAVWTESEMPEAANRQC